MSFLNYAAANGTVFMWPLIGITSPFCDFQEVVNITAVLVIREFPAFVPGKWTSCAKQMFGHSSVSTHLYLVALL